MYAYTKLVTSDFRGLARHACDANHDGKRNDPRALIGRDCCAELAGDTAFNGLALTSKFEPNVDLVRRPSRRSTTSETLRKRNFNSL